MMLRSPGRRHGRIASSAAALGGSLLLAVSCAQVGAPPGGPEDRTPPQLEWAQPESGSVALSNLRKLSFRFSEKMDRQPAERWLYIYPPVEYDKTKWRGARTAEVILREPLPADTVIVIEIGTGLRDAHRVSLELSRRFPIATSPELPVGEIFGLLVKDDEPLKRGVVELFPVPPDSMEFFEQKISRRAVTDSLGRFRLSWLPAPSGPYLLRAFDDASGDLRWAENEAVRLLPDTVSVDSITALVDVGLTVLYSPDTPGRMVGRVDSVGNWSGGLMVWPLAIAEEDTGWVPEPPRARPPGLIALPVGEDTVVPEVPAGLSRLIFFVDADGDSNFSVLPASEGIVDSTGRSVEWFFEAHAVVDSLVVEPGLEGEFTAPVFPQRLTPWYPEPVSGAGQAALSDSTAVGSVAPEATPVETAAPDTTVVTPEDAAKDSPDER